MSFGKLLACEERGTPTALSVESVLWCEGLPESRNASAAGDYRFLFRLLPASPSGSFRRTSLQADPGIN